MHARNDHNTTGNADMERAKEHILIAEDDAGLLSTLSFLLRSGGHRVTASRDGQEALERIQEFKAAGDPVDLLITDIQMPRINGLRLIQSVTAGDSDDFPIIVITGHGDKDMVVELMRLGCDDFLDKPFEPQDVQRKVREVMERRRLKERARGDNRRQLEDRENVLSREVSAYKLRYEALRSEVRQAVGAYRNMISLEADGHRAEVAFRHHPLHDLGGDYLDLCDSERGMDIMVADVAGHDLSASYQTILVKAFFQENCTRNKDGRQFFQLLNQELQENGRNERMVTAIFLTLDFQNMGANVITAGHPKIIRLAAKDSVARMVPGRGSPLGLQRDARFAATNLALEPGDRLFLYTDGVISARHVDGPTGVRSLLGEEGLLRLVNVTAGMALKDQVDSVMDGVQRFCRYRQSDDMLLFGVEIPLNGDSDPANAEQE